MQSLESRRPLPSLTSPPPPAVTPTPSPPGPPPVAPNNQGQRRKGEKSQRKNASTSVLLERPLCFPAPAAGGPRAAFQGKYERSPQTS